MEVSFFKILATCELSFGPFFFLWSYSHGAWQSPFFGQTNENRRLIPSAKVRSGVIRLTTR